MGDRPIPLWGRIGYHLLLLRDRRSPQIGTKGDPGTRSVCRCLRLHSLRQRLAREPTLAQAGEDDESPERRSPVVTMWLSTRKGPTRAWDAQTRTDLKNDQLRHALEHNVPDGQEHDASGRESKAPAILRKSNFCTPQVVRRHTLTIRAPPYCHFTDVRSSRAHVFVLANAGPQSSSGRLCRARSDTACSSPDGMRRLARLSHLADLDGIGRNATYRWRTITPKLNCALASSCSAALPEPFDRLDGIFVERLDRRRNECPDWFCALASPAWLPSDYQSMACSSSLSDASAVGIEHTNSELRDGISLLRCFDGASGRPVLHLEARRCRSRTLVPGCTIAVACPLFGRFPKPESGLRQILGGLLPLAYISPRLNCALTSP